MTTRRREPHHHHGGAVPTGSPAVVTLPLARRRSDSGGVWVLDGLEVTMVGNVAARLTETGSGIRSAPAQIGVAAAIYIAGACLGALFFGQLTDRFGRKKLFILTLAVYLAATVGNGVRVCALVLLRRALLHRRRHRRRVAAINSAIDE